MKDPKKKLDILKESADSGIIGKDDYKELEQKLEADAKKFDEAMKDANKQDVPEEEPKSEKTLIISIVVILLLLGAVLAYTIFNKPQPKTLEDLHVLNLKGKLKPEQGYVYKGIYSFVKLNDLWYTQLSSPKGTKTYSMALRYSPNELKSIAIEGRLNSEFFNNNTEFYVTFNPTGKELSYVALAIADFDTHMTKVFEKKPIAACDRNETNACNSRPIVTCEDHDNLVLYIKESDKLRAYYKSNCIVIEGNGFDLVRGVDRVLYNLYNIMGQEEK